jgi:hypothetical protein
LREGGRGLGPLPPPSNSLSQPLKGEEKGLARRGLKAPPCQPFLRVGRGFWGEGRDLRSLPFSPNCHSAALPVFPGSLPPPGGRPGWGEVGAIHGASKSPWLASHHGGIRSHHGLRHLGASLLKARLALPVCRLTKASDLGNRLPERARWPATGISIVPVSTRVVSPPSLGIGC